VQWYSWFWLIWVIAGILFELFVLFTGIEGGTLSEHVWKLRDRGGGWFSLLMFFLAWMIYHFIRENVSGSDLPPDIPAPTPEEPPVSPAPPTGPAA
jgi:hypothetical protein